MSAIEDSMAFPTACCMDIGKGITKKKNFGQTILNAATEELRVLRLQMCINWKFSTDFFEVQLYLKELLKSKEKP